MKKNRAVSVNVLKYISVAIFLMTIVCLCIAIAEISADIAERTTWLMYYLILPVVMLVLLVWSAFAGRVSSGKRTGAQWVGLVLRGICFLLLVIAGAFLCVALSSPTLDISFRIGAGRATAGQVQVIYHGFLAAIAGLLAGATLLTGCKRK